MLMFTVQFTLALIALAVQVVRSLVLNRFESFELSWEKHQGNHTLPRKFEDVMPGIYAMTGQRFSLRWLPQTYLN